jgi:hypothetical protein
VGRTRVVIGILAAVVIGLGVALAVVVASDDDSDEATVTQPPTQTVTSPVTTPEPTTTTEPTTTSTRPAVPTISQERAKDAARAGASRAVQRFGISIPADDWDARCTAVGGRAQAAVWRCQVAANRGQCAGTITAYATAPGEAGTRDDRIGCGE